MDSIACLHIEHLNAGASGSLDQDFQFAVFGRAGESKVSGLLIAHVQDRDLTRNESHTVRLRCAHRQQIKRASVGPLIAHASDDEGEGFGLLHRSDCNLLSSATETRRSGLIPPRVPCSQYRERQGPGHSPSKVDRGVGCYPVATAPGTVTQSLPLLVLML